jgi:hypothetical protein
MNLWCANVYVLAHATEHWYIHSMQRATILVLVVVSKNAGR